MLLHDFFEYQAREKPGAEFAVQGSRTLTYGEAATQVNQTANALIAAGLQIGDRAAVLSKNSIEYAILYLAASKAGVALVPLNYRLAPPEWSYIINDCGAELLLSASEYATAIDAIRGELTTVSRYVVLDGSGAERWDAYCPWIDGQPVTAPDRVVGERDDAYQMYTSGTTGHPKGAVITHAAVTSNMVQTALTAAATVRPEPGQRWLIVAPMYHAAAAMTTFDTIFWGSCLYIMADFNPAEMVRVLSEERIALAFGVPAMIQACLMMAPDVAQRNYDTLKLISYGGSPIAEQTLRRAMEVFQCEFNQGYGMTETTSTLSYLMPEDHHRALREKPELLLSAGRPLIGTQIRIVDEDDNPVPNGTVGEIVARGPQIMKGYWNKPEATDEALRGGWMHTGDAGMMDGEGFIFIQDRVKDMIVSGGENVYPREVEEVLFKHPAVADAAVIGVPDPSWGEAVKAIVVLRQGEQATQEDLMEFCRGRLAGFKRPRTIDFAAELPRNPSGKVLKRQLREPFWAGRGRRVEGA